MSNHILNLKTASYVAGLLFMSSYVYWYITKGDTKDDTKGDAYLQMIKIELDELQKTVEDLKSNSKNANSSSII